jgi:hypothetical protein
MPSTPTTVLSIKVQLPPLSKEYSSFTGVTVPVELHLICRVVSPAYQISAPLGWVTITSPLTLKVLLEVSLTLMEELVSLVTTLMMAVEPISSGTGDQLQFCSTLWVPVAFEPISVQLLTPESLE